MNLFEKLKLVFVSVRLLFLYKVFFYSLLFLIISSLPLIIRKKNKRAIDNEKIKVILNVINIIPLSSALFSLSTILLLVVLRGSTMMLCLLFSLPFKFSLLIVVIILLLVTIKTKKITKIYASIFSFFYRITGLARLFHENSKNRT